MKDPIQGNCFLIFCDGACSGNPGPGGWGAVLVNPEMQVQEFGGAESPTTNNRMEITGLIEVLRKINPDSTEPIYVYTDSTYVIYGITQWIHGWRRNQWKNSEGQDVANQDLWRILDQVVSPLRKRIDFRYSRGHSGIPGNERCDEIAVARSQGRWVDYYSGSLLQYDVPIFDLPEETKVPELKSKAEKKKAVAYLSYLDGEVVRHSTWPQCDARVKGRSGAKFKKLMDLSEEKALLAEWGLPLSTKVTVE